MIKKYYSKVSYGLLAVIFVVLFAPLILNVVIEGFHLALSGVSLGLITLFVFILHLFFNTVYTIKEEMLYIKCGIFSYKPIVISQIREIRTSSSIISSPAASFDRIEIKYGKFDEIILSPKDKWNFAQDLVSINPAIQNHISEPQ